MASVAFSQIGFTALYATFGASPTSRINTAFTYRLTYQDFRVAAQAQVGGYNQGNAATEQYQAQIGTDFRGFSFDVNCRIREERAGLGELSAARHCRPAMTRTPSFARRR